MTPIETASNRVSAIRTPCSDMKPIDACGKMVWVGLLVSRKSATWTAIDDKHMADYHCMVELDEYFSGGYYAKPFAIEYVNQGWKIHCIIEEFKLLADIPQPEHYEDRKDYEWTRRYRLVYTGPAGVELPEIIHSVDDLKDFTFVLEKI